MNLNEEVRCDHLITTEMKKLWAEFLDIYDQIDQICKRHNLTVIADGGTLLGAVRHKGFIPWDDDFDLDMYIDDYLKFIEYAKDELKEPYFLQTCETEPGYPPFHLKIRKSGTTCFTGWELEMSPEGHRGIFVDIFPIYNIPDDEKVYAKQVKKLQKIRKIYGYYQIDRAITKFGVKKTRYKAKQQLLWKLHSIFTSPEKLCRQYMDLCNLEKNKTKRVGLISFNPGYSKIVWPSEWIEKTVYLPFEDIMIPAPHKYEEILTAQFGDWHEFVKGTSLHSSLQFSTDTDYRDYLKNLKAADK